jgi:hypothetical protein
MPLDSMDLPPVGTLIRVTVDGAPLAAVVAPNIICIGAHTLLPGLLPDPSDEGWAGVSPMVQEMIFYLFNEGGEGRGTVLDDLGEGALGREVSWEICGEMHTLEVDGKTQIDPDAELEGAIVELQCNGGSDRARCDTCTGRKPVI